MPNHVTHKLIFAAEHAEKVFAEVCTDQCIDFEKLVPSPTHIYRGDLSADDDKDFKCNWSTWQRENWGTKWNAYQGKCFLDGDNAVIQFQTAWSIPYPIVSAFANKFQIPFEHRYCDEAPNYWGIEKWGASRWGDHKSVRTDKQYSKEADRDALMLELLGRVPSEEEA
jgi:hypothetical protein